MSSEISDPNHSCVLAARASTGLFLRNFKGAEGGNNDEDISFVYRTEIVSTSDASPKQSLCLCRVFCMNSDGSLAAYCNTVRTVVVDLESGKEIFSKDLPKTNQMFFSPKSTFFITWEPYFVSKDRPEGQPNLHVWNVRSGELVAGYVHKKHSGWQPQFSEDESVCIRLVGSEILCHMDGNLSRYDRKAVVAKVASCSLSKGGRPFHVACYIPGLKGQPGVVRLLNCTDFAPVASKTFWKADRVSMLWNNKGSAVVIMAIIDVDSTGQSYYGQQNLYLVMPGGDGFMVPLGKGGPVYHIDWSPTSTEFCVVYGYMPASATMYNLKGESVMEFGTGPRNECYYNTFGNLLCICGFGNLRGNMEFWSVKDKKKVAQFKAEDTTQFQWAPDGIHFATATIAPRLRVNNGYKVWKYTGELLTEVVFPEKRELWEVKWKPERPEVFSEFSIDHSAPQTTAATASSGGMTLPGVSKNSVYVPPHLRNRGTGSKPNVAPSMPPGGRKKPTAGSASTSGKPQMSTRDKKMRNVQKKLKEIESLKAKRDRGEDMEKNQLTKIEKETELLQELNSLNLEDSNS